MPTTQQTTSGQSENDGLYGSLRHVSRGHAAKAFWGILAASHTPAIASCWDKIEANGMIWANVASCILLAASMTFFLLKIADVPFLRFRLTRKSGVALCVLVTFMHFDALRPGDDPTLMPVYASLIAATTVVGRSLVQRRDLVVSGAHEHQTNTLLSHELRPTETVWTDLVHPHCWTRCMRLFALRAPPV